MMPGVDDSTEAAVGWLLDRRSLPYALWRGVK
jgi:hypothetical protein